MPKIIKEHQENHIIKENRIINGFPTEGPLPYQLRSFFGGHCGATLISRKFAISAEHCYRYRVSYSFT